MIDFQIIVSQPSEKDDIKLGSILFYFLWRARDKGTKYIVKLLSSVKPIRKAFMSFFCLYSAILTVIVSVSCLKPVEYLRYSSYQGVCASERLFPKLSLLVCYIRPYEKFSPLLHLSLILVIYSIVVPL